MVFLISDFLDSSFEESLRITARRHDVTAVTVTDPRESELPAIGLLELQDSESGEMIVVDTSDEGLRRGLQERTAAREESLAGVFRSHGVGELRVETHRSPVEPIVRFFRRRERARDRWS